MAHRRPACCCSEAFHFAALTRLVCSHVYNVEPPSSASEYLHRAGRSGRIGSTIEGESLSFAVCVCKSQAVVRRLAPLLSHRTCSLVPPCLPLRSLSLSTLAGVVTTLVTPEQLPALQSMAAELGITITELPPPPPELPSEADADVEAARRGLEDLFNLY